MGAEEGHLTTLGDVGLVALLVGLIVFLVTYSALARWWRTAAGRHVAAFMAACCLVVGQRVLRMGLGAYPGEELARAVTIWGAVAVTWWRVTIVVRSQIATRRGTEERERHEVHP